MLVLSSCHPDCGMHQGISLLVGGFVPPSMPWVSFGLYLVVMPIDDPDLLAVPLAVLVVARGLVTLATPGGSSPAALQARRQGSAGPNSACRQAHPGSAGLQCRRIPGASLRDSREYRTACFHPTVPVGLVVMRTAYQRVRSPGRGIPPIWSVNWPAKTGPGSIDPRA